jgi:hypothetical protein
MEHFSVMINPGATLVIAHTCGHVSLAILFLRGKADFIIFLIGVYVKFGLTICQLLMGTIIL